MYYYEAYDEQGVTLPSQAVNGLLFAVDLVPRDFDLRLMAVRQLLKEGDGPDVRATFGPIAYYPHFGKTRRRNLAIMDKTSAGGTKGALQVLEEDKKAEKNS